MELFEKTYNYVARCFVVFCASTCDDNVVCAIKYFIVTFFRNDFFVLATSKALWQGRNLLWVRILNNLYLFRKLSLYSRVSYSKISVRVTFDGDSFHPAEGLFRKIFLSIYYIVIAWDRTDFIKHLLARKYFIIVQLRSPLFALNCFRITFLNAQNGTFWKNAQLCCTLFRCILRLNVRW